VLSRRSARAIAANLTGKFFPTGAPPAVGHGRMPLETSKISRFSAIPVLARDVRVTRRSQANKATQIGTGSREMENTIYIGLSRQTALRRELSLVANNIANINTTAFKRELGVYATAQTKNAFVNKLDFVIDHGTAVSFEPGALSNTGNDLDIAINGPGFIGVDDGSGVKYTRNGALSLSPDNQLITREGHAVVDEDGAPIVIPLEGGKIEIGRDGSVSAGAEIIAKIQVVEFKFLHLLQKNGDSLFESTEVPQDPVNSTILQGSLERANVTPVKELVRMIDIQRSYDAVKGFLDREAERQQTVVRRLGRNSQGA
jgi:flagellar basal-body rod protein FlgF